MLTTSYELRPVPEECQYTYKVHHANGGYEWTEDPKFVRWSIARGSEVILHVYMDEIEVDGIKTNRLDHRIHQVHFYEFKPLNDEEDVWDSPYVHTVGCEYCEKDFELDETRFLQTGAIYCVCSENGED